MFWRINFLFRLSFAAIFYIMKGVGIGTRVFGFLIDMFFVLALSFAAFKGWSFYVFYYGYEYISFYYFLALITFLYYLFFESIFRRTPGKWLSLSKVVNNNGGKPSFLQIVVRSLVRVPGMIIIDCACFPFLEKTLHDYVSRTQVVEI